MVHLHCAERGISPNRPTDDIDTVLDIRAHPTMLETFTSTRHTLGFRTAGVSPHGHHTRGPATGHRSMSSSPTTSVHGPPGAPGHRRHHRAVPGRQQALHRTEWVDVHVSGRSGTLPRPTLLGTLIAKAAAVKIPGRRTRRHLDDTSTTARYSSASPAARTSHSTTSPSVTEPGSPPPLRGKSCPRKSQCLSIG